MLDSLPEAVKSASDSNRVVTSSMSMKGVVNNTTTTVFSSQSIPESGQSEDSVIVKFKDYQTTKEDFEKEFIVRALKANMGKINQTAREAGIPKKTLLRKIEKYAINPKEFYPKGVQIIKEDDEDEGDDSNE